MRGRLTLFALSWCAISAAVSADPSRTSAGLVLTIALVRSLGLTAIVSFCNWIVSVVSLPATAAAAGPLPGILGIAWAASVIWRGLGRRGYQRPDEHCRHT